MFRRVTILFWLLAAVSAAMVAQSRYVVTASTLNVRTGPSTRNAVAHKLHRGDTVVVLGQSGQWATIQRDGDRYYASSRYLRYIGPVPQKTQSSPRKKTIWDTLFEFVEFIIWILVIVAAIGFFISNTIFFNRNALFFYLFFKLL